MAEMGVVADGLVKAAADDGENLVAVALAEGLIDLLKAVEVDPQSGDGTGRGAFDHVLGELKAAFAT